MRTKVWRLGPVVFAVALLCVPAAHGSPDLFEAEPSSLADDARVRVGHDALATAPGGQVRLNVQPGMAYDGRVTTAWTTASGGRVVRGVVPSVAGSSFLAVERGTGTAAAIWISPTERYALDGSRRRVLRGPSTALCAHAGDPVVIRRPALQARPQLAVGRPADEPATPRNFDVLVVYTPAALAAEGNADALAAQAELAMADANTCYENSGVPIVGRIVGVEPVDYVESGEIRTDLHALATPDDGVLDEVQPLRDAAEADFVCLFTNRVSADGYEGYAEIMTKQKPDYEALAYSVVNVRSAAVEHLFAHELGHNMGCDHDRENTTGLRLFHFSYGWRFTAGDGILYRDVMAYAPGASIPYFGSPLVSYLGVPTGVADYADTARTLATSAPTFINFRPADGLARVAVRATVPQASVASQGTARAAFQFERTGSVARPLTVAYQPGGTAVGGAQYETLSGSITIPAGRHYTSLKVSGVPTAAPFGAAAVTLTLQPAAGYVVADDPPTGAAAAAAVTLLDVAPLVSLGAPILNKTGGKIKFPVNRLGPVDAALTVAYTVGGSAVAGVDYQPPANTLTFAPGETAAAVKIKRLDGDGAGRTVEIQLAPDASYNLGSAGTAAFALPP